MSHFMKIVHWESRVFPYRADGLTGGPKGRQTDMVNLIIVAFRNFTNDRKNSLPTPPKKENFLPTKGNLVTLEVDVFENDSR